MPPLEEEGSGFCFPFLRDVPHESDGTHMSWTKCQELSLTKTSGHKRTYIVDAWL